MLNPNINSETITIEKAVPGDAESIMRIKRDCWFDTYENHDLKITKEVMAKKFSDEDFINGVKNWSIGLSTENPYRRDFVAKKNNKIVGFTAPHMIKNKWRLGALYVDPKEQKQGIGNLLILTALDWLGEDKDVYIEVVAYNKNAINFYKKYGFIETDEVIDDTQRLANDIPLPCIGMVRSSINS